MTAVTWNPSDKDASFSLDGTNLIATSSSGFRRIRATLGRSTGKWYFEVHVNGRMSNIGLMPSTAALTGDYIGGSGASKSVQSHGVRRTYFETMTTNSGTTTIRDRTFVTKGILQVAVDLDALKIWFGDDGVWINSGNPGAGTNASYTNISLVEGALYPTFCSYVSTGGTTPAIGTGKFDIMSQFFQPPSGFAAWDSTTDTGSRTVLLRAISVRALPTPLWPSGTIALDHAGANRSDGANGTLSENDLKITSGGSFLSFARSTYPRNSGKYYFEAALLTATKIDSAVGLLGELETLSSSQLGVTAAASQWSLRASTGNLFSYHQSFNVDYGTYTRANGDVIGVAVDFDNQKLWFAYNNSWKGSGDPAAGTNPVWWGDELGAAGQMYAGVSGAASGSILKARFAASDFSYTPPTGFLPWDVGSAATISALTGVTVSVQKGNIALGSPTIALTGVTLAATKGLLTPDIRALLSSKTVSALAPTTLNPTISKALTGITASISLSPINSGSGFNPTVALTGVTLAVTAGSFPAFLTIGDSVNALLSVPKVRSAWVSLNYFPADAYPWRQNDTFISYRGDLYGSGEQYAQGVSSTISENYYSYVINEAAGSLGNDFYTHRYAHNFNTANFGPWYMFPGLFGTTYSFNRADGHTGRHGVGTDGSRHWLFQRVFRVASPFSDTYWWGYQNSKEDALVLTGHIDNTSPFKYGITEVDAFYGHTLNNAYVFYTVYDSGAAHPAYVRYTGSSFGAETNLTGLVDTGYTFLRIGPHVIRTGYGDSVYLEILLQKTADTFVYQSYALFDAVAGTTSAHTTPIYVANAIGALYPLDRYQSQPDVAKLSGGTSLTQYYWGSGSFGKVRHLSWTSGTLATPVFTVKTGTTDPGWESFVVRGDTVRHYRYAHTAGTNSTTNSGTVVSNDATGTGDTWTSAVTFDTWGTGPLHASPNSVDEFLFVGGCDPAGQTFLFHRPCNNVESITNDRRSYIAWLDWWGGFSVVTYCEVGTVTVTLLNGISSPLTGLPLQVNQGALGVSTSISMQLSGKQLTVAKGNIVGGDLIQLLAGKQLAVQTGALGVTITQSLSGAAVTANAGALQSTLATTLFGQQLSVIRGVLTPGLTLALSGQQVTVQNGSLSAVLSAPLSSIQLAVQRGGLQFSFTLQLSGYQLPVLAAPLTPVSSIQLAGKMVSVSLTPLQTKLSYVLTGWPLTLAQGAFTVHSDVSISVTGVQTICQVGVLPTSTNVPPISTALHIWAQAEVEKLFTQEESDASFS